MRGPPLAATRSYHRHGDRGFPSSSHPPSRPRPPCSFKTRSLPLRLQNCHGMKVLPPVLVVQRMHVSSTFLLLGLLSAAKENLSTIGILHVNKFTPHVIWQDSIDPDNMTYEVGLRVLHSVRARNNKAVANKINILKRKLNEGDFSSLKEIRETVFYLLQQRF